MLDRYLASPYRQQAFSKHQTWYLLGVTAIGGLARILYHLDRPFVGDEVGTLLSIEKPVPYLLSHFQGWLTQNYFILAEKIMAHFGGGSQISLLLIPLAAGVATIPLTALLARRLASTRVAMIAATLVAANPYLISFSGIIRAYSLLAALALLVVILLLRWYSNRVFKNGIWLALACLAMVLAHPSGAFVLAYVLLLVAVDFLDSLSSRRDASIMSLLVPLSVSIVLIVTAYVRLYPAFKVYSVSWHGPPPTSIANIPYVLSAYFGKGYFGWISLILLIPALFLTFKDNRPLWILVPYAFLPVVLMAVQGIDYFPWASARYLIFVVPVAFMFIAAGVEYLAALDARPAMPLGLIVTLLLVVTWLPGLMALLDQKLDYPWSHVGNFIKTAAHADDVILYRSSTEWLELLPYLASAPSAQFQVENYAKKAHVRVRGKQVFVVRGEPFLVTDYPSYAFGKIEVIVYPRARYADQLAMIRDDFLKSIKTGELSPELADDYRDVWVINRKLGQADAGNFKYYQLYTLCNQLSDRERNIPLSLQYQEYQTAVQQDVLNTP